jgi:hypothetical protein
MESPTINGHTVHELVGDAYQGLIDSTDSDMIVSNVFSWSAPLESTQLDALHARVKHTNLVHYATATGKWCTILW